MWSELSTVPEGYSSPCFCLSEYRLAPQKMDKYVQWHLLRETADGTDSLTLVERYSVCSSRAPSQSAPPPRDIEAWATSVIERDRRRVK